MMKKLGVPSAALTLVATLVVISLPSVAQAPTRNNRLVAAAADLYGLDAENLRVLHSSSGTLPLTGVSLTHGKVLDQTSGRTYGVSLDAAGELVDFQGAQAAEIGAYEKRFGTMTIKLAEVLAGASPTDVIKVGFWLHANHNEAANRSGLRGLTSLAQADAAEAAIQDRVHDAVVEATRPFVRHLVAAGHRVDYVAPFSPAVFARVPAAAVRGLSEHPAVQTTYWMGGRAKPFMNVVKTTTAATKVHSQGITGIGVNAGVVECCDSLFEEDTTDFDAENNAYLARIHELRVGACAGDHSHPTAVSGIIASTHPQLTGIGYNGRIIFDSDCEGDWTDLVSAAQDVSAQVSGATNHSYGLTQDLSEPCVSADQPGGPGLLERALDDLVRNNADSQYVAAGNDGNAACVASPAVAWNIVAVGGFNDNNTNGWSDDTIYVGSQGGDPGSNNGDRTKPEVAGPAVAFQGLLPSPGGFPTGNIGNGTSYATPAYVGGATLAHQLRPALLGWPEGEKAVMLATACHNIEGSQVNSELDGAGGPDFFEMRNLLNANRFTFGSISNGSGVAVTQTFTGVSVGNEVRVALAWDTNTSYSLYGTDPADDLDLAVKRPDGSFIAFSSSFDNTYEVVEFVADQAGTYTIEVNRFRTDDPAGSTFYGLAWHRYSPSACTAP